MDPGTARRELVVPAAPAQERSAPRALPASLVRVQGFVRCAGRAQAGYDLSFEPLGPGPRARGDWDLTDEDGRFEVELQAARYAVRDERDVQVAEVVVPAGRAEFVLDFDLPQAWRNTLVGGDSP